MKRLLPLLVLVTVLFPCLLFASEAVSPLRILYIGNRDTAFMPFLKQHFAGVEAIPLPRDQVTAAQVKGFDVVLLDWPQSHTTRGAWLDGSPLGQRDEWNKPTVLLGSAGLNLAVCWKLKGGSGCTCLAPVAYDIRQHEIFQTPVRIDVSATVNIPTPTPFVPELKTDTISVLPLVDNITNFHTVINNYQRGWATHYYEFADMPEVEVFSGGINEQTPRSAAFWRQGNLLHFGFEQSPAEMNETGRAMLVNAITYISRFTEDRPIDVTPSVFGQEKIAVSRNRAKGYFTNYPREVTNVFSAATLATFDWQNAIKPKAGFELLVARDDKKNAPNATEWFESARPWLHPNAGNFLEIDTEAKSLGVPFDAPDFLPKTIAALRDEKTKSTASVLLTRYVFQPFGTNTSADKWEKWWQENSPYLFYSELGGYRWYIDPLAKKRGIPTKDLRGALRADVRQ